MVVADGSQSRIGNQVSTKQFTVVIYYSVPIYHYLILGAFHKSEERKRCCGRERLYPVKCAGLCAGPESKCRSRKLLHRFSTQV